MRALLRLVPAIVLLLAPVMAQALPWDVPADHIHRTSIEYAVSQKIIRGYEDRSFRPESAVLRSEFTVILARALLPEEVIQTCLTTIVPPEKLAEIALSDADYGSWYGKELCALQMAGVIEGYPDNTFRPLEGVNLAETSKILANAYTLTPIQLPTFERESWQWYLPYARMLAGGKVLPPTLRGFAYPVTRGELAVMLHRLREPNVTADISIEDYLLYEDLADPVPWIRHTTSRYGFTLERRRDWPMPHWLLGGRKDMRLLPEHTSATVFLGVEPPCYGFATCVARDFAVDVYERDRLTKALDALLEDPSIRIREDWRDTQQTRWVLYQESDCRSRTLLIVPRKDFFYRLSGPCRSTDLAHVAQFQRMARTFTVIPVRAVKSQMLMPPAEEN